MIDLVVELSIYCDFGFQVEKLICPCEEPKYEKKLHHPWNIGEPCRASFEARATRSLPNKEAADNDKSCPDGCYSSDNQGDQSICRKAFLAKREAGVHNRTMCRDEQCHCCKSRSLMQTIV